MANLTSLEKKQFEDLLGMASGYVMNFNNNSFKDFFYTSANIDIFNEKYNHGSGSKANRLRSFWEKENDKIVGKVLIELLARWDYENENAESNRAYVACKKTADRLVGKATENNVRLETPEEEFLGKDFGDISLSKLKVEATIIPVLEGRLKEAQLCLKAGASLATIFLTGSILEGALLGTAQQDPQKFNQANSSPKKDGQVKRFHEWTLKDLIEVAYEVGLLKLDVKKFSDHLRDFRNYIHPYAQMSSGFSPDVHTAKICFQVLRAAIVDLSKER